MATVATNMRLAQNVMAGFTFDLPNRGTPTVLSLERSVTEGQHGSVASWHVR